MLENIFGRDGLVGLARQRSRSFTTKTIHPADLEQETKQGWTAKKQRKRSIRLIKNKPKHVLLEDRMWTLLYQMGFNSLSGEGGAKLKISTDPESPKNQIDCVAIDGEVALAVECKTFSDLRKDQNFQEKIAKLSAARRSFSEAVSKGFPSGLKRHIGTILLTHDILVTESDCKRAEEQNVVLFDEKDLTYYESLLNHLGPAAKYQVLADIFPSKQIAGLKVTVPALQTKFGDYKCYTFSIHPEYLLKIAFVSHRARGKNLDVDAYQRMIKKSRLKKIRDYISEDGIFPTNIVLNLENSKYVRFDLGKQEGTVEGARVGWLTLEPAYKSAWVIDGQHRLFAYSGHKRATSSYLSVVAFENLPGHMQAKLFVDINHEQKSVKRSLLDELWAELHWDSSDPEKQVRAIISKAVQGLNQDRESPFYDRILLSDAQKTERTCISLSSILGALDKTGFYITTVKRNIRQYGPLWAGDQHKTAVRTQKVLNAWFQQIANKTSSWWDLGAAEGGGLAMNDGVTTCINVLRSVLDHLQNKIKNLVGLDDSELVSLVDPFAIALGDHLGRQSDGEKSDFRALRGIQGQTTNTRFCQHAVHLAVSEFNPSGLDEFIEQQKANTNEKGRQIIDRIERTLQTLVLDILKREFCNGSDQWWFDGVPISVRKKVTEQVEESGGKQGGREENFNLIHYKEIALHNWTLFESVLAHGTGNKEKRIGWISEINDMRKIVMHPSKRQSLPLEKMVKLDDYDEWLQKSVTSSPEPEADKETVGT